MVYTAVGCLGVSALSDLIKEVYHIPLILCCVGFTNISCMQFKVSGLYLKF